MTVAIAVAGSGCKSRQTTTEVSHAPSGAAVVLAGSASSAPKGSAEPQAPPPIEEPLLKAALEGDLARVKKLVASGSDPALRDEEGRCAIALAAGQGHEKVVAHLLSARVPQDQREHALVTASGGGHIAVVKQLLTAKASTDARSPNGITPLILAGYAGQTAVVDLLLQRGADPNQRNDDSEVPLHTCAAHARADEIVPLLLKKRADFRIEDKWKRQPLQVQAQEGRALAVRALLEAGAPVDHPDSEGQTALVAAAARGHASIVSELLARGADKNVSSGSGVTSLMVAAKAGHLGVVKALVEAGADLKKVSEKHSVLSYAIDGEAVEVVRYLVTHGMSAKTAPPGVEPPLLDAAALGKPKVIPVLVAAGADVNALRPYQDIEISPLMLAAGQQHPAAVEALIAAGADVTLIGKGKATALHLAALGGCLDCAKTLVARGASIDAKNNLGGTPLRSAADGGHLEIVRFLLARGAKPSARDDRGLLPVDYAREKGHRQIVELLESQ